MSLVKGPSPPFPFLSLGDAARSHIARFKADVSAENQTPSGLSDWALLPCVPLPNEGCFHGRGL